MATWRCVCALLPRCGDLFHCTFQVTGDILCYDSHGEFLFLPPSFYMSSYLPLYTLLFTHSVSHFPLFISFPPLSLYVFHLPHIHSPSLLYFIFSLLPFPCLGFSSTMYVRSGMGNASPRPPCDGTPSDSVWPSPKQTPGPSCPYPSDRTPSGHRASRRRARHAHILQIGLHLTQP